MDEQPELVKRTDKVLQSNSYIVYRLTGVISQDLFQCYGWQNYDVENRRYDEAMTRALGIDKRFLIEPVASDHVVARVNKEAAALCGLVEGIPVVAGGLDAACAALGVGVIDPGQIQEQGGQASGISICTNSPIRHRKLILSSHVIPDRWLLQGGTVAGGASVNWFAQNLGGMKDGVLTNQGDDVFEKLSAEAEKSPAGANGLIFLPYLNGERSPIWDAKARGMYFGLKLKTTHADMIRAVMEGVGFALRHNLETASETGISIHELRPMGGAAHSVTENIE